MSTVNQASGYLGALSICCKTGKCHHLTASLFSGGCSARGAPLTLPGRAVIAAHGAQGACGGEQNTGASPGTRAQTFVTLSPRSTVRERLQCVRHCALPKTPLFPTGDESLLAHVKKIPRNQTMSRFP